LDSVCPGVHPPGKLVIAKLDRLSRNVAFVANLLEAGTDFVAVDNPHANKPMVQMMAVFAEMERDAISKRTKEALAAAKAKGTNTNRPIG
jgi:DNA invertase Pin-like site-specific DNA recombinase